MSPVLHMHDIRLDEWSARRFDSVLFSRADRLRFAAPGGFVRTQAFTLGPSPIRFGRITSTGHVIELAEENRATLLIPERGRLGVRIVGHDYGAGERAVLALRPTHRETTVVPPSPHELYSALIVMLPLELLERLAGQADGVGTFLGGRDGGIIDTAAAARLRDYLERMIGEVLSTSGAEMPERAARGIVAKVEDLLHDLAATEAGPEPRLVASARVREAEDLLRQRSDEPLSVAALADELGVGLRSLQLSFRQVHDMSPHEMLVRIRLERARQRLLAAAPDERVTTIALDSGFTHLGRFAELYRRVFGERPSETIGTGQLRSRRRQA